MDDIDFHDNTTDNVNAMERNQYRTLDRVGTVQGTKEGDSILPDRIAPLAEDTCPIYIVAGVQPGDWLNYTRSFPNGNYNVYLRLPAKAGRTCDSTRSPQVALPPIKRRSLRGEFLVPNNQGLTRFRYVPLTDSAGNLQTLALSGVNTLRLTMNQERTGKTPAKTTSLATYSSIGFSSCRRPLRLPRRPLLRQLRRRRIQTTPVDPDGEHRNSQSHRFSKLPWQHPTTIR